MQQRVEELFNEIGERHGIEIDTMEKFRLIMYIFSSRFHLAFQPEQVVGKLKAITAKVVFEEFPGVKSELWGGEFWEDGYFAGTAGDKVTAEVIRRYIEYHESDETKPEQLGLF